MKFTLALMMIFVLFPTLSNAESVNPIFIAKAELLRKCGPKIKGELISGDQYNCIDGEFTYYHPLAAAAMIGDLSYLEKVHLKNDENSNSSLRALAPDIISIAAGADSQEFLKYYIEKILLLKKLTLKSWNELRNTRSEEITPHPIFLAIDAGNLGIVAYFLSSGVQANLKMKNGLNFDVLAMVLEHERLISFFREYGIKATCDFEFPNGTTSFEKAKSLGLEKYYTGCE